MQIEWSKTSDPLVLNDIETNFNKSIDRRPFFTTEGSSWISIIGGKLKSIKKAIKSLIHYSYELNKSLQKLFNREIWSH